MIEERCSRMMVMNPSSPLAAVRRRDQPRVPAQTRGEQTRMTCQTNHQRINSKPYRSMTTRSILSHSASQPSIHLALQRRRRRLIRLQLADQPNRARWRMTWIRLTPGRTKTKKTKVSFSKTISTVAVAGRASHFLLTNRLEEAESQRLPLQLRPVYLAEVGQKWHSRR